MLEAAFLAKEIEPNQDIDSTPVCDATQLTRGGSLAKVRLEDQVYFLRITRTGRHLLTM